MSAQQPLTTKSDVWARTSSIEHKVTFKWTIDRMSTFYGQDDHYPCLCSPAFSPPTNPELAFGLQLHPNGQAREDLGQVAIFVGSLNKTEQRVSYSVSILNSAGAKLKTLSVVSKVLYHKANSARGWSRIMTQAFLLDKANGMITDDDKLTIYCELTAFSTEETGTYESLEGATKFAQDCHLKNYSKLLTSGKHSDVVLCFGPDKNVPAHKNVLGTHSPLFDQMFSVNLSESQQNRVEITDTSADVFAQMLHFMYVGRVKDEASLATTDLLIAAEKYQMDPLKNLCEHAIARGLDVQKAADILVLSRLHTAHYLRSACIKFIREHAAQVFATDGWKRLLVDSTDLAVQALESICTGPTRSQQKRCFCGCED